MTPEIIIVFGILVCAVILFATEKLSVDLVALLIVGGLLAFGLVTPQEGISGLSNSATVTVACMFVLSAGLQKTGVVSVMGELLAKAGRTPLLLLIVIMLGVAVVSAFLNNTAAVAVFLPVVLATAAARKTSASRLLIPLSYASQFGGVCTLIGTSTNLLVSSIAADQGLKPFSMFEFAPLGLIMMGVGTVFILIFSRWLLPERDASQLVETYGLREYVTELHVSADSEVIGKSPSQIPGLEKAGVNIVELIRADQRILAPRTKLIEEGDMLLVRGQPEKIIEFKDKVGLELRSDFELQDDVLKSEENALVEVMIGPQSRLAGESLSSSYFEQRHNLLVLGLQRRGHTTREKLANIRLRFGDALLLCGPKEEISKLGTRGDAVVLNELGRNAFARRNRMWVAISIMAAVVGLAAFEVLPILVAALLGCAAMALTGCLRDREAYEAVDWRIIILLAGVLPLGLAMQKTGAAALIADTVLGFTGDSGPVVMLAVFYLLTAILTEAMSNNASAVLLAPIAISTAAGLGVDPRPFLVAVTFAASTSFATPVGYQTNTMVYAAGNYRFTDFLRLGLPLNLIFWGVAVYFIPRFFPF